MRQDMKELITILASKMGENDTPYSYKKRLITEFAGSLEKLFVTPDVSNNEMAVCSRKGDHKLMIIGGFKHCPECGSKL